MKQYALRGLIIGLLSILCLRATADEPVFFEHYAVIDGDTIDISGLIKYKQEEYLAQQGLQPPLMYELTKPVDWPRTLTTLGVSIGLKLGIDHTLKHAVGEWRPDGSDRHSFPSRHATWAYGVGAKLSYMFAPYTPWVPFLAHSGANIIGFQRIMTRQHYPHDVLGGAVIGISTDLLSRAVGNWIFGTEPLFPMWRTCSNLNGPSLSMTTGATLPLARNFGDSRLGASLLRADLRNALPLSHHWAFVTDITLESGFLTTPDDFNHNINMVSACAGAQYHWGNGPCGLQVSASLGYRACLAIASVQTSRGSMIGNMAISPTVMVTPKLSLGATFGASLSRFGAQGQTRMMPALSAALLSTAYF